MHRMQKIRRNSNTPISKSNLSKISFFFLTSKLNHSNNLYYQNLQNNTYSYRKKEIPNISKLYSNQNHQELIVQETKTPKTPPNNFSNSKVVKNSTILKDFTQTTSPKTSIIIFHQRAHKKTSIPILIHHKSNIH